VCDDEGRAIPETLEFGLDLINISKRPRKYLLLNNIGRLFLESSDFHGLDTWYLPDLTYGDLVGYGPLGCASSSPTPPLCIARSHVLAKNAPGKFRLLCADPPGLPGAFYPYLTGSDPKIQFIYHATVTWTTPRFEYLRDSLGWGHFPQQDPTCPGQNLAAFSPGSNPWNIPEKFWEAFAISWKVKQATSQASPKGVHQMTVYDNSALACVVDEKGNALPLEAQIVLPPEIVEHVLSFLPFWEDRFPLASIVKPLANHVWRLGFEIPMIHFPEADYSPLMAAQGTLETLGQLAYVPGPYQIPTQALVEHHGAHRPAELIKHLNPRNITRRVTYSFHSTVTQIVQSVSRTTNFKLFEVEYEFPNGLILHGMPIYFKDSAEFRKKTPEEQRREIEDHMGSIESMIFTQLSDIVADHQERLSQEKRSKDRAANSGPLDCESTATAAQMEGHP
jgi:hypothetical protein